MAWSSSWVHGNATRIEEDTESRNNDPYWVSWMNYGWGFEAQIMPGHSFWFHIPLPTPVYERGVSCDVEEFYLLWRIDNTRVSGGPTSRGRLLYVHLYDGARFITDTVEGHEHNVQGSLGYTGDHLDFESRSVFHPNRPERVRSGLGISFEVTADGYANGGFIPNDNRVVLTVGGAGARYHLNDPPRKITEEDLQKEKLKDVPKVPSGGFRLSDS